MKRIKERGITLIALVITIIVLLILAGVALATLTGNGSIIDNANYAVGEYNKSANEDQNVINKVEDLFAKYLEGDAEYKITYNANGGTGTMEEEEASRTGTSTFTPPEGKVFKEWNTAADGSGTSYAAGETVPSDVTLYAIWVTEAIQQQYGNLVNEQEDTINQDLFAWEVLTEPSVAVVRNISDGAISRGDTPAVTTQKGTAKITGINWQRYLDQEHPDYFKIKAEPSNVAGSEEYEFTITNTEKKEEIEEALRKLIVPYEVTREVNGVTKTYIVTTIDSNTVVKFEKTKEGGPTCYTADLAPTETTSEDTSYLIIPTSVTSIGNLKVLPRTKVIFSAQNSITAIPDNMAKGANISEVILPSGILTIGDSAFADCHNLSRINIPNTVTTIGDSAFDDCPNLSRINIPNTVTTIGADAFGYCGLTSIDLPNSLTLIDYSAFYNCDNLTTITIPNSIETIKGSTFAFCDELASINLPDGLKTIGGCVFESCPKLASITIPDTVESIGGGAFWNCTGLQSVTYKGTTYTKIAELISALESNNVELGVYNHGHFASPQNWVEYNETAFQNVRLSGDN